MRSEVVKFKTSGGTTYDSVTDWGFNLIHCNEQKPAPKFNRVDVPGANGSIDLSAALTNNIPFEDRVVELTFFKLCSDHSAALTLANTVAEKIHGKQLDVQTPDSAADSTWYHGDVEITSVAFEDRGCEVNVKCTCDPFRLSSTGGSKSLTASTYTNYTDATPENKVDVTGAFTGPAAYQFEIAPWAGESGHATYDAFGLCVALTSNLFDLDNANVRAKTVKVADGVWKSSGVAKVEGQTLNFGAVASTWIERFTVNATNATADIVKPVFPFHPRSFKIHLYSEDVTAVGSAVTVGGVTYQPGVTVRLISDPAGASIGADGMMDAGTETNAHIAAPSVGTGYDNDILTVTATADVAQIIIDVASVSAPGLYALVEVLGDGTSSWVEPDTRVYSIPTPASAVFNSARSQTFDYVGTPVSGTLTRTGYSDVDAQGVPIIPDGALYVQTFQMDSSGWLHRPINLDTIITVFDANTVTVSGIQQPVYPTVTVPVDSWVSYNGDSYLVGAGSTLLPGVIGRGSTVVDYAMIGFLVTGSLTYPLGVL